MEILFAYNFSMIKQESSWQRVRYYLEVGINKKKLEIKWIYGSRGQDLHIERVKGLFTLQGFVYIWISSFIQMKTLKSLTNIK